MVGSHLVPSKRGDDPDSHLKRVNGFLQAELDSHDAKLKGLVDQAKSITDLLHTITAAENADALAAINVLQDMHELIADMVTRKRVLDVQGARLDGMVNKQSNTVPELLERMDKLRMDLGREPDQTRALKKTKTETC